MFTVYCSWVDWDMVGDEAAIAPRMTDEYGTFGNLDAALSYAGEKQADSTYFNLDMEFPLDTTWYVVEL